MAAEPLLRSPRILDIAWGQTEVEDLGVVKDVKLWLGGGREWDWRETGTQHVPGILPADVEEIIDHGAEVVVLSRGIELLLRTAPETLNCCDDCPSRSTWKRQRLPSISTTGWLCRGKRAALSTRPAERGTWSRRLSGAASTAVRTARPVPHRRRYPALDKGRTRATSGQSKANKPCPAETLGDRAHIVETLVAEITRRTGKRAPAGRI